MLPTDYSVFFIYIPPKKAFLPRSVVYGRGRNAFLPAIRLVQETIPPLIMPNANEESFKRIPRHCTHDKILSVQKSADYRTGRNAVKEQYLDIFAVICR